MPPSLPPTVVIDTNVVVAAGFKPASDSARLLEAVRDGTLRALWSDDTRAETEHVVGRIPPLSSAGLAALFPPDGRHPAPSDPGAFSFVPDPADRKFAALAAATGAALVTMDEHLLGARDRIGAPVLTPSGFLRGLRP